VLTTDDVSEMAQALKNKTRFVHFMIRAGNDKAGGDIPMKAVEIKDRFMRSLRYQ
jgi:sulfopyruvate decarboxylase subunit beta